MRNNIKTAETTGDMLREGLNNNTFTARDGSTMFNAARLVNLLGDTALIGGGIGLSWCAAKKLIEKIYRNKLEKNIRGNEYINDAYRNSTSPIQNNFITPNKYASYKSASSPVGQSQAKLDSAKYYGAGAADDRLSGNTVYIDKRTNDGFRNRLITALSESSIYSPILLAGIPAMFAGASWLGNSIGKATTKALTDDAIKPLNEEKELARKRYSAAAKLLKEVGSGLYKSSAINTEKKIEKDAFFLLPTLGLLAAATGLAYKVGKEPGSGGPVVAYAPNPKTTDNSIANALIYGGIGLGSLAMLGPGYRFVQNMRKGYNDRVSGLSDVTRAAQAWEALRNGRHDDYNPLRAALEDEPDPGLKDELQREAERQFEEQRKARKKFTEDNRKPNITFTSKD